MEESPSNRSSAYVLPVMFGWDGKAGPKSSEHDDPTTRPLQSSSTTTTLALTDHRLISPVPLHMAPHPSAIHADHSSRNQNRRASPSHSLGKTAIL